MVKAVFHGSLDQRKDNCMNWISGCHNLKSITELKESCNRKFNLKNHMQKTP